MTSIRSSAAGAAGAGAAARGAGAVGLPEIQLREVVLLHVFDQLADLADVEHVGGDGLILGGTHELGSRLLERRQPGPESQRR
jgi:hypothetical protein